MRTESIDFLIALVETIRKAIHREGNKSDVSDIVGITDSDVTRKIDRIAEDAAIDYLRKEGFNGCLISEESPPQQIGSISEKAVILDPLDGSTNFIRSIPFSSISVALASLQKDNETLHLETGVVKDLSNGDLYYADKGYGAYLNGEKTSINQKLDSKPLVSVYAYGENIKRNLNKIHKYCNIRAYGSIALELAYVTTLKLDGLIDIREKIRLLDIAAGKLILEEAGGVLSDDRGNPLHLKIGGKYSVIASKIHEYHEWFIDLLKV